MQLLILLIQILGAISLFIFSIKFLSENLQALAGSNFKRLLSKITSTNSSSILAGTFFTVMLQSSSASTVFIISFLNAGLINIKKSIGLILGANIGTTLTLWLIYFGLKTDHLLYSLPILFIAFPLFFTKNKSKRKWGNVLVALSLLFISIHLLKSFLPNFNHSILENYLINSTSNDYLTYLIFIFLGIIFTIIIHFSSAAIAIAILFTTKGLPIEIAAMFILGANIGTTFTAHVVAALGNYQCKLIALFHTLFNISCAILVFFFVNRIISYIGLLTTNNEIILICFDMLINCIGVIIFIPFINKISAIINNQKKNKTNLNIKTYPIPFNNNSELYKNEVKKKLIKLIGITKQIIHILGRMLTESDVEKIEVFRERIQQLEKEGDVLEIEVKNFFNEYINFLDYQNDNKLEIHQLITLCNNLESIGDIAIKIASNHKKRRKTNSFFTPKMREYLFTLQNKIEQAVIILNQNLSNNTMNLAKSLEIENSINNVFKEAENNLYKTIEKEKLQALSAIYYKEIIQHYEQLGDYIYSANKTLAKINEY